MHAKSLPNPLAGWLGRSREHAGHDIPHAVGAWLTRVLFLAGAVLFGTIAIVLGVVLVAEVSGAGRSDQLLGLAFVAAPASALLSLAFWWLLLDAFRDSSGGSQSRR